MPPRRSARSTSKAEDKPTKKNAKNKDEEEEESEEEEDTKTQKGKKGSKTAAKAQTKAKAKAKKDEDSDEEDEDDKKTKGKGRSKSAGVKGGKRKAAESEEDESDEDAKKPAKKVKGGKNDDDDDDKKITKVVTKGGAAVDKLFPTPDCHVYIDGGEVYAKTLNQSSIGANANKFYIVQVLQSDKDKNLFYTWNRWGRIGYDGQTAIKSFKDATSAIKDFNKKITDKTVKGDYVEVDITYDDEDEDDKKPAGKRGRAKDDDEDDEEDEDDEDAGPKKKLKTGDEVKRVNTAWDGIEKWYKKKVKDFEFVGGASDKEIQKLEKKLKVKFDEEFKASLRRHNGVEKWPHEALLSIEDIEGEWDNQHEMDYEAEFPDFEPEEEDPRRVKKWWCDQWIPFAGAGDGILYMIDFKPTKKGKLGQILDWNHETGPEGPKYDSFTDYIETILKDLEGGKYKVEDGYFEEK